MRELDPQNPKCPIRNILNRLNDKWSLLILLTLNENGVMRYKALNVAIPDISQKMLASSLKRLEADKLINRKMYSEIPPRVEYSLTEIGKDFIPSINPMIEWALKHFDEITG
ncbi:MAG: winged helix-turn-helix transcriptional regulator [Bacteroidales bacterium]